MVCLAVCSARTISPILMDLFNLSLKQVNVPDSWKISKVNTNFQVRWSFLCCQLSPDLTVATDFQNFGKNHSLPSHEIPTIQPPSLQLSVRFRPRSSIQEALLSVTNELHLMPSKNRQVASLKRLSIRSPMTSWFYPLHALVYPVPCYSGFQTISEIDNNELSWMVNPPALLQPILVYPKAPLWAPSYLLFLWTQSLIYFFPRVPYLFYMLMTFCCIN